jgi:ATP/maltotriose-dependent transcriptional regulator MalT
VLSSRSVESASGLVAIANGWPAVIGLAGVSTAEVDDEIAQVPESLYRFFAHEVFAALGDAVQTGLTTLAAAPILDRELAARLLGDDEAAAICTAALHVGVLVERDAKLELHPLARAFLEERGEASGVLTSEQTIACCFDYYWERRDWDAAFELISRHELGERFEPLLTAALDELLDTARLSTIDTWCERAAEEAIDGPIVSIARAEVALRHGRHAEAQAQAERAAAAESEHVFRALSVSGRAAHLASREEDGLDLYRRAEAAATTSGESRDAQWGQLRCLIDLESSEAPPMLSALLSGVRLGDPRDVVQAEAHRLHLGLRVGTVDLDGTEVAEELLESVNDPLVRSSFLSALAAALALAAKYGEALDAADELLTISEKYRLNFARPYGLCMEAIARAGLRQWGDAEAAATEARDRATASRDSYAQHVSIGALLRVLTQQGRHRAALAVETSHLRRSLPSAFAELSCSRALALAIGGRTDEARRAVSSTAGVTRAIEPVLLAEATLAICALKDGDADAPQIISGLEELSFSSGALDLLVVAYRSCPELLSVLLRLPDRERFHALMRRVGDDDLARALGHSVRAEADPMSLLSPRELEVAQLIGQGLTNRQIANVLFISESTVKRHAHNIYAKLGTSSRRALVVHAALQRSDQATSATEGADSSA